MASRLNKNFLLILTLVILGVGGLGGGVIFIAVHKSIPERIEIGDQYMDKGQYKLARKEYSFVVRKDPKNVDALIKFIDATSKTKVLYGAPTRKAFGQMYQAALNAVRERPDDAEIYQRLVDMQVKFGNWDALYETSKETLSVSPDMFLARKYRGMAAVNRMLAGLDLTDEQRLECKEDLQTYLKDNPEDDKVIYSLALWHIMEAHYQNNQPRARKKDVEKLKEDGVQLMRQAHEREPENLGRLINHAKILMFNEQNEQARQFTADIEKRVYEDFGTRDEILNLIGLIRKVESPKKGEQLDVEQRQALRQRISRLCMAAVESWPDDLNIKYAYALSLASQGQNDEALAVFEQIHEVEIRDTPVEASINTRIKQQALIRQVDLTLNRAEKIPDRGQRETLLTKVDPLIRELHGYFSTSVQYNALVGKLALMRGQWQDAVTSLRMAAQQTDDANPEIMLRLAIALEKIGQGGAAIQVLDRFQGIPGMDEHLPAWYQLIRLNMRHKQYVMVQQLIDDVREKHPDDKVIEGLQIDLYSALDNFDQALAHLEKMDSQANPRIILIHAQLLARSDRRDQAVVLLEQRIEQQPDDLDALGMLISLSDDKEQSLAYIKQVRQGGVSSPVLLDLEKQLKGEMDPEELIARQIERIEDPMDRLRTQYQMYRQFGLQQKAEASFAEAQQLQPDHSWVVDMKFERALGARDWDQARQVASRAAMLDLDRAQGMFYYGRLAMGRSQFEQAVTHLQEGVAKRRDFAIGWILLADAQRNLPDLTGAIESYEKALRLVPDNLAAINGLAQVYSARQEHEQALAYLKQSFDYQPKNRLVRDRYVLYQQQYGDKKYALQLRRQWAKSDPEDLANRQNMVLLLADLDHHDEAQQILDKIIEERGADRTTTVITAQMQVKRGQVDKGRRTLTAFIKNLGEDVTIGDWLTLGRFCFRNNQLEPALSAYNRAIAIEDPQTMPATRDLAVQLYRQGRYEIATRYYQKIIDSGQGDLAVAQSFVESLVKLGRIEQAQAIAAKMKSQYGVDATSYLLEALIAFARQQFDEALEHLDRAEQLAPRRDMVYALRARVLKRMDGRQSEAISAVTRSLQLNPTLTESRLLLAELQAAGGEVDRAISELQILIRSQNQSAPARIANIKMSLVQLYLKQKQWDQAKHLLETSAREYPTEARWPFQLARLARQDNKMPEVAGLMLKAFELQPSPTLLSQAAVALIKAEKPRQAISLLRDNVKMLAKNPILNSVRGWALSALDQASETQRAFELAVDACENFNQLSIVSTRMSLAFGSPKAAAMLEAMATPQNQTMIQLIIGKYEVGTGDFTGAAKRLGGIDAQLSDDSPLRSTLEYFLARALHFSQEYRQAKVVYERAIKRNPQDANSMDGLAYLLSENTDDSDAALPYAQKAAELAPDNIGFINTLGMIQMRLELYQEAELSFRKSVELRQTAGNTYHLAQLLVKRNHAGDKQEALQYAKLSASLAKRYRNSELEQQANQLIQQLELEVGQALRKAS